MQEHDLWYETVVQTAASPLTGQVALGRFLNLLMPQFPHFQNGDKSCPQQGCHNDENNYICKNTSIVLHIKRSIHIVSIIFWGKKPHNNIREIQKNNSNGGGRRTKTSHTRQKMYLEAIEMETDLYSYWNRQTMDLNRMQKQIPQTYGWQSC